MDYNDQVSFSMMPPPASNSKSPGLISDLVVFDDPDAISRELFSYLLTDINSSSPSPASQDTSMLNLSIHPMQAMTMNNNPMYHNLLNTPQFINSTTNSNPMDPRFYPHLSNLPYDLSITPTSLTYIPPSNPPSSQVAGDKPSASLDNATSGAKKRARRRHDEINRTFDCIHPNCSKSYGTLSNLNHHITMQKHGRKRLATEFET